MANFQKDQRFRVANFIINPANKNEMVIVVDDTSSKTYKLCKYSINNNKCTEYFYDYQSTSSIVNAFLSLFKENILRAYLFQHKICYTNGKKAYTGCLDISHLKPTQRNEC